MDNEEFSNLTPEQWRKRLGDKLTFEVCRQKGTEPPGSGRYLKHKTKGKYVCIGCKSDLFRSEDKLVHCGWPSFRKAIGTTPEGNDGVNIKRVIERYDGEDYIEVQCNRCSCHFGYLLDEPCSKSRKRYCVNSVSLDFVRDPGEEDPVPSKGPATSPKNVPLGRITPIVGKPSSAIARPSSTPPTFDKK